jgi:hypothetical protein
MPSMMRPTGWRTITNASTTQTVAVRVVLTIGWVQVN